MLSTRKICRPGGGTAGRCVRGLLAAVLALPLLYPAAAQAASAAELQRDASRILKRLYAETPKAKELGDKAKGILVFPSVIKAGFMVGGLFGEGVLLKDGKAAGYYNTVAVSYGYQAGAQKYGYAMFLMTDKALQYLDRSDGWEVGTGPSIVVLDKGAAGGISSSTARDDVYAFIFNQTGLMAGLGLQGTKITKIDK
ncbi:MAG TPA: lipid-binding SYLF domain-containing protein [Candidatus Baltobacteraceae bacterium]|nr:lipid-binding SYLF domain-containing protein [Candidatus Baltobacteraceae bacterium]